MRRLHPVVEPVEAPGHRGEVDQDEADEDGDDQELGQSVHGQSPLSSRSKPGEPSHELAPEVLADLLARDRDGVVDLDHALGHALPVELLRPGQPFPDEPGPLLRVVEQRDGGPGEVGRVLVDEGRAGPAVGDDAPEGLDVAGETGVPEAIASSRTMPKLSPPVFGAT